MGTTSNFSWPYPESSDYVADGATAIENLADAADTTVKARSQGLVMLAEATATLLNITAENTITSNSFTAEAGRNYVIHLSVPQLYGSGTQCYFYLRETSATGTIIHQFFQQIDAADGHSAYSSLVKTFSAGSVQLLLRALPVGGNVTIPYATNKKAAIIVMDGGS